MSHRYHGQSRTRDGLSLVFAFFFALSLLAIGALVALRVSVFSEAGFRSVFSERYYEAVLDEATNEARYFTQPTGIDPSVVDGVFVLDEVRADVSAYISTQFGGLPYSPGFEGPRARLKANAERAMGDYTPSGDAAAFGTRDEIVAAYVDDIMGVYQSCIEIPGMGALMDVRALFMRYFWIALAVFVGLAGVLGVSIRRLHHHKHRALRFVAYGCGGAALMSIAVPLTLYASGFYRGLSVSPEYFYLLCTGLISHVLLACVAAGVVWLLLMAVTIVCVGRLRKTAIKSHHSR